MIYDGFIFFNELDLLEIRLNELDSVVDKFVIVEATKTFTNQPKELIFENNKEQYSKFLDKIIHIVVDDFPPYDGDPWKYELYQRNAIARGFKNCKAEDIVMVSDLDEIPAPDAVLALKDKPGMQIVAQLMCYYYINCIDSTNSIWYKGTRILSYQDFLKYKDVETIRQNMQGQATLGGWHFSYLGGTAKIKEKIEAFSHQEFNSDYYKDPERLEKIIAEGKDLFDRNKQYAFLELNDSFPAYVRSNKEKFAHLIKS